MSASEIYCLIGLVQIPEPVDDPTGRMLQIGDAGSRHLDSSVYSPSLHLVVQFFLSFVRFLQLSCRHEYWRLTVSSGVSRRCSISIPLKLFLRP